MCKCISLRLNKVVVVVKKCRLGNFFCNFLRIYLQYYCGDLSIMATFFSVLKVAIVEGFIGIFFLFSSTRLRRIQDLIKCSRSPLGAIDGILCILGKSVTASLFV